MYNFYLKKIGYILPSAIFLVLLFSIFEFNIPPVNALSESSPSGWKIPVPQISIPTVNITANSIKCSGEYCDIPWIGEYLAGIFKYAIGIAGILAAIMLMVGGVVWLTAGGNAGQVTQAQDYIKGSLTGLVLALLSYTILYTVNPELVNFRPIRVKMVKEAPIGADRTCSYFDKCNPAYGLSAGSGCTGDSNCTQTGSAEAGAVCQVCCCYTSTTTGCSWKDSCGSNENDTDGGCGTYWGGSQRCCCTKGYAAPAGAKLSDFKNITSTAINRNQDINNLRPGLVGVLHDLDNAGVAGNISTMIGGHSYYVDGTTSVSLHMSGQAVDFSCSSAAQCSQIAQWLVNNDSSKISQLIYYPAGGPGYGILDGKSHVYNPKTQNGHATHIHLAVR